MDQISQIKQNLNIVDIVGKYVELKKSGRNYKGVCPFHSENTPSFMVSSDLQIYKCFGCGASGDLFEFIQQIEGINFTQALEQLAEKAGVELEKQNYDPNSKKKALIYELNDVANTFFRHMLMKHKAGKPALEYLLKSRKLNSPTLESFELGYAPDSWDVLKKYLFGKGYLEEDLALAGLIVKSKRGEYIDKFRNRITFPLIDVSGKIVGFTGRVMDDSQPKYLNSPETLVFHKSSYLYGLDKAKVSIKKDGVIFVEGQVDVVNSHQAGIENVVASSGTSLTSQQFKLISRYTNEVTFCFDSDSAGVSATFRAIDIAEAQGFDIRVAVLPDGFGDLDDLLKKDKSRAKKLLKETLPVYDFFIQATINKYEKETAYGKRKITEELLPRFSRISSEVVQDFYISKLGEILNINEEVLKRLLNNETPADTVFLSEEKGKTVVPPSSARSTEEYMLALLFNAELELAQNILYKLGKKDFTNDINREIFVGLKEYVLPKKRNFQIKNFLKKLNNDLTQKAEELYLWDLSDLANSSVLLEKEVLAIFKRIKKDTINRELLFLQRELKEAELENDSEKITELSTKVYKISKLKRKYE